jgi:hypothetical protein
MISPSTTRRVLIDWQLLACRFGCRAPVAGLYNAAHSNGCWCYGDHIQALCEQHAVKALQNNDMTILVERPPDGYDPTRQQAWE